MAELLTLKASQGFAKAGFIHLELIRASWPKE